MGGFFSPAIFLRYDEDGTGFIDGPDLEDIGDDRRDDGFRNI